MMCEKIPVYSPTGQTGELIMVREGLYWRLEASVQPDSRVLRLYLLYPQTSFCAGVPVPERGSSVLRRRISCRCLPQEPPRCASVWCSELDCWQRDGAVWRRAVPEGWALAEPLEPGRPLRLLCAPAQLRVEQVEGQSCAVYWRRY